MKSKEDSPGVHIPPPVFFLTTFFLGILLQHLMPVSKQFFQQSMADIIGVIFLVIGAILTVLALRQFFKSNNTVATIKPATSLQTTGIYTVSRNPMYLSLVMDYCGFGFIWGNWWNFILLPFLIIFMQAYVIGSEEKYLQRRFGDEYTDYKSKVRRWL